MVDSKQSPSPGWLTLEVWAIALAIVGLGSVVSTVIIVLSVLVPHNPAGPALSSPLAHLSGWSWTLLSTLSEALFGVAAAVALRSTIRRWWTGGPWRWAQWMQGIALGLVLGGLLTGLNILWVKFQGTGIPSDGGYILNPVVHHPGALIAMLVMISFFGPVMEEWLFRGALQPSLASIWGARWAVVVVSLMFAGVHELDAPNPAQAPWLWAPLLPLALVLGWLRVRTKGMSANIGAHMGFNLWSSILLIVQVWH
ncbi:MAG: CPBP family intramembrane metalloprotease [Thermaerobacter sp.]|nr:CPBP family intramembrane metalloprotease [Thermaerobacter sp.]